MRLLTATLRNYRLHRDLTVAFDRERTLIGGPNETGKSTLVEAIHRALFLRAKGTSEYHRAMESTTHGGKPEVELTFESGGRTYHLHKRFSGANGTITLTGEGSAPLNSDEAEEALARLLSVEHGANNRTCAEQHWAHVWIWQGVSGQDPAHFANLQKQSLLQRLGQTGGAANLVQSATDARVADAITSACDDMFTQRGEPKANSELARALDDASNTQSTFDAARDRLDRLQQALQSHAAAEAALVATAENLAKLTLQRGEIADRLARLEVLRRTETGQSSDALAAATALATIKAAAATIHDLREQIRRATDALTPRTAELDRLAHARTAASEAVDAALKAYDAASERVRVARQEHDLVAAHVTLLGHRQQLAQLRTRADQADRITAEVAALRATHAKLPAIEPAKLKRLRKLEETASTAAAALDAMAAGIELLASDQPVSLGEDPLVAGQPQVVTEDTELRIGSSVRIRIRPGGGTSLTEARKTAQDARLQFRRLLDELGVADTAAAHDIARQRDELAARIEAETKRLSDLGAAQLPAEIETAQAASIANENDVARRAEALHTGIPTATDPAAVRIQVDEAARKLEQADHVETKARATRDAATRALATADEAWTKQRIALEQENRALHESQGRLQQLLDQHGDDDTRHRRLDEAVANVAATTAALNQTRQAIAELQPDHLPADQARIARALDQANQTRQDAETQRAVAANTLQSGSDGSADPQADLGLAEARRDAAQDRLSSVRRRAEAIKLLDELFRHERQALADQLTRPLVDKASSYLQCLFGAGARLDIRFEDQVFSQPHLIRPAQGLGSVAFENLSGGTKEQVAAALRLAMAEVLAADHHGSLPLIFDDAFAYADPDRVQTLQRMLDLAANRGLQVIVLTCTPSDYAALGARTISWSVAPALLSTHGASAGSGSAGQPGAFSDGIGAASDTAITDTQREQFLTALRSAGGRSGNSSLRERLGWDESTYDAAKRDMIERSMIAPGKGRGGSVSIAGDNVPGDET